MVQNEKRKKRNSTKSTKNMKKVQKNYKKQTNSENVLVIKSPSNDKKLTNISAKICQKAI